MQVGDLVYWVYGARSRPERALGVVLETDVTADSVVTQHRIVVKNTRLVVSVSSLEVLSESR